MKEIEVLRAKVIKSLIDEGRENLITIGFIRELRKIDVDLLRYVVKHISKS